MLSPSSAQQAEACGYAEVVRRRSVPTASPYAAFGGAFAALVDTNAKAEEVKAKFDLLTAEERERVMALVEIYQKTCPRPTTGVTTEWQFSLLPDGSPTGWEDTNRITRGKLDARWWEDEKTLVFRDDKTGFLPVEHPANNLQFGVYAKALENELPMGGRLIAEVCNPTKEPADRLLRYEYQPGEIETLWQRFLSAERKSNVERPVAEPTPEKCSACWQRQQCEVRLLPAMMGTPGDLAFASKGGPGIQTMEDAVKALTVVSALKEVVDRAEEQLSAWAVEHGGISDGNGKLWKAWPTNGRRTGPSLEELELRGMGDLIKLGRPGTRREWRREK